MNKAKQRYISLLLAIVMVMGMLPSAFAEETDPIVPDEAATIEQQIDVDNTAEDRTGPGDEDPPLPGSAESQDEILANGEEEELSEPNEELPEDSEMPGETIEEDKAISELDEVLSEGSEVPAEDIEDNKDLSELDEEPVMEIEEKAEEVQGEVEPRKAATFSNTISRKELHVKNGAGNDEDVDERPDAGSHEDPFLTIGGAIAAAMDAGLRDVTILLDSDIESGKEMVFDYPELVVTIKSCGKKATIQYSGASNIGNESGFIKIINATCVAFENVSLKGSTGTYNGRVVYVSDYASVALTDVTVSNGRVNDANFDGRGGAGVFVDDHGAIVIEGNSVIQNNETNGGGGGVYVADGGSVEIYGNVAISNNRATNGGGVYAATQTSEDGRLKIADSVSITKNEATNTGSGMYIEKDAKACAEGRVSISNNLISRKASNVYLADEATLDISGATVDAKIGISADPEFAYRLISLPAEGYTIASKMDGDEKGWTDDCDQWDIRYMVYNGQPGLYLCGKSVDAIFNGVDTLENLHAADINGEVMDYINDDMPAVTISGSQLSAEGIILKDGTAYTVTLTVDPEEYRLPTKDVIVIRVNGVEVEFGYDNQGEPEGDTLVITLPADVIAGAKDAIEFDIAAEKLYDLTLRMNGPLFALSEKGIIDNRFGMKPIDLSEAVKEGTHARYKLTRGGVGVAGIDVTICSADGEAVDNKQTGADGVVEFDGLDEVTNYYIIAKYDETFKVIARDVLNVTLSTLPGQTLGAEYSNTTGNVDYDRAAGKAVIDKVKADGSVEFGVEQAKDRIIFEANTENAMNEKGEIRPASNGEDVVLSQKFKEMPGNANTYGALASAELAGYKFLGWFDAAIGGNKVTYADAYIKGESATTLYAHWQASTDVAFTVKHFVELAEDGINMRNADGVETITFEDKTYYLYDAKVENDGESDKAKDLTDKTLSVDDMTEAECSWWTRNGFTAVFDDPYVVSPKGDSVFNVMYDRNIYTVVFKNNGVEGSEAKVPETEKTIPDGEVKFGDNYGDMPIPTLPGYEFAGWYDDTKPGEEGLVTEATIHKDTNNVELTAHWNAKQDTKWAIKVVTQNIAQDKEGKYYLPGTYTELKTVYLDNDNELLSGVTDTVIKFNIADIDELTIEGFNYVGYADSMSVTADNKIEDATSAEVYVKPTDMSTDLNGNFNKAFDGGLVWLYYDRMTKKPVYEDGQGNKVEDEDDIIYGGDFTGHLPPAPGTDGYDFDHWADPDDEPVDENTPADKYVTEDGELNIHPEWTARKYNLTYVPGRNGSFIVAPGTTGEVKRSNKIAGGYIDPNQVTYDKKMGTMPSAHKNGYNFDGWFVNDEKITENTIVTVKNVVISNANENPPYEYENTRPLYAQYTPHQYTLVLDPGKSSKTGEVGEVNPDRVVVTFDDAVSGMPIPTLRGYRFMGWVLSEKPDIPVKNGMTWDMVYPNGTEIPVKAIWVPENYRYTFHLNDQIGSTRGQLYDPSIDYVDEAFGSVYDSIFAVEAFRPGYNFMGWSLTATGEVLKAEDLVALSENRILYAIWEPKLYDVKLVMKGGKIADLTSNDNMETYDPTASYDAETDTWTVKVAFDSVYGLLPVPVKEDCSYHGYLAVAPGWPAKEGYGVTIHEQVILSLPQYIDFEDKDGISLIAVLEPWFTFDPDGGKFIEDGISEPKKELQSNIDKLPDVTKEGYTYEGWVDEGGNDVTLDDVKTGDEPKVLKPKYVANITFDGNGGKVNGKDKDTMSFTAAKETQTASRNGYNFQGWFTSAEGGEKINFAALKAANVPVIVYAQWKAHVPAPSGGGGGGGGGYVPTPAPKPEVIEDPQTPLAGLDLLTDDHVAYIAGFTDGTVRPLANITRAEVAMIFYRLLKDQAKAIYQTDASPFDDVEAGAWYTTAIATLANAGILNGRGNGIFDPGAEITRAEFAAICARFDDLDLTGPTFNDVPSDHWAYAEIVSAAAKGWVKGIGNGMFAPDREITRAEAVTLINRVLKRASENGQIDTTPIKGEEVKVWPDNRNPSAWYHNSMIEATHTHDHESTFNTDETLKLEYWTAVIKTVVGNK